MAEQPPTFSSLIVSLQGLNLVLNRRIWLGSLVLTLSLCLLTAVAQQRGDFDDGSSSWKEVEQAIDQGLPKTAIEKLEPLIQSALDQQDYAAAIKAISMKVVLEASIQGNKPEEKITRMRSAIDAAPAEMKPVMEAILANWYWHFFQQNRWRFQQRTATAESPSDDLMTWSLPRILSEIDQQFDKALAESELLKNTPVQKYDALLEK